MYSANVRNECQFNEEQIMGKSVVFAAFFDKVTPFNVLGSNYTSNNLRCENEENNHR